MKPLKTVAIAAGSLFAVAHIGLLGYLIKDNSVPEFPAIQFPRGDYSSCLLYTSDAADE